jgi:ribosomal-protein-alanine N-acetyltransferase
VNLRRNKMSFKSKFDEFKALTTERLTLRQFVEDDVEDVYYIKSNPVVDKYMGTGNVFDSIENAKSWIQGTNSRFSHHRSAFTWGIALKETEKIIGYIQLDDFVKGTMAEVAFWLSPDHWNKGFMTEAVQAVTNFGFEFVGFHRIQAKVMVENEASIKVLKKAGYQQEGILRKYPFGKYFEDVVMLSKINEQAI